MAASRLSDQMGRRERNDGVEMKLMYHIDNVMTMVTA